MGGRDKASDEATSARNGPGLRGTLVLFLGGWRERIGEEKKRERRERFEKSREFGDTRMETKKARVWAHNPSNFFGRRTVHVFLTARLSP